MLNITLIEQPVLEVLKKAGWYTGRKFDISNWVKQLTNEGYKCFPYAVEILEELGGLDIKPERVKIGKTFPGDVDFYAFDAGSGEYDRMEIFEHISEEPLFPLGMVFGQWFLYVGLSKKIYMGSMKEFYMLGSNIEEFLNNLILGNEEACRLQ